MMPNSQSMDFLRTRKIYSYEIFLLENSSTHNTCEKVEVNRRRLNGEYSGGATVRTSWLEYEVLAYLLVSGSFLHFMLITAFTFTRRLLGGDENASGKVENT